MFKEKVSSQENSLSGLLKRFLQKIRHRKMLIKNTEKGVSLRLNLKSFLKIAFHQSLSPGYAISPFLNTVSIHFEA